LYDKQFRAQFTAGLDDPEGLHGYWQWYDSMNEAMRAQVIGPVLARLRHLLLRDFHQPGRRPDGTVPNIGGGRPNPMPDTVSYLPEGFDGSALHTLTRVLDRMLAEDRRSYIR
jgi:hypothetical protein